MALIPRRKRKNTPSPTRQKTGTSYTTSPASGIKAPQTIEIGSQLDTKLIDPVAALNSGYVTALTYKKMVRGDASVRVSLRAGKAPVLGAEFFIDPYSDDPQDLAIWDFVDFNLFGGMTTPWSIVLEQILKMYESSRANSIFELVWENREFAPRRANSAANRKQYTMLRKMAYRPDLTINTITYDDNGGPVSITQNAVGTDGNTRSVDIPIEKAVVFVLNQEETVLEGMPILRSAYKHWFYKDRLYAIDAIQKERHGIGVPDIVVLPGASAEDKKLANELGRNLRTNEFAHIVRPPSIQVGFAQVHGNVVDVMKSIEHHDTMIMKNIMVQFLNAQSSRQTSATAMDMFLKSMRHIADSICDAINLYVIPPLVAYNFNTDNFPQIKARNVGEVKDLQMWSSAMRNLINVGAITVDEETEAWIRAQLDMPKLQTPWKPYANRPDPVTEVITAKANIDAGNAGANGNGSNDITVGSKGGQTIGRNGGGGNIGKSPSSGAV